jgi:excisionase family DNA binding protein
VTAPTTYQATDRSPVERVWLTIDEASQRCGVSKPTLYAAARDGELRGYQRGKGGTWRVHVDDLDAWMRGASTPSLKSV